MKIDPDSSIMGLVSNAWAGFGAAFGPLVVLSLYWKRTNLPGESAVDIIAARIPQRNRPPTKGSARSWVNTLVIISINTFSAEPAPSVPKITG